jgi:integrase
MAIVRLKGINSVKVRLKGGQTVTYHYAWKGGPRLTGAPGSPEFIASYNAAVAARKAPSGETLASLIVRYKMSPAYTKLGAHTMRAYAKTLDTIKAEFGTLTYPALEDPKVRRHFMRWRDTMADRPRTADMAVGVLKRVLAWGVEYSEIGSNQAEPITRLHDANRADSIWTADDFAAFAKHASPELRWAVALAAETGLRQSDLIGLTWRQYDGRRFEVMTSKRNKEAIIPVTATCRALMETIPKRGFVVLTTERGKRPWTADGLRSSFGKACKLAKVKRTFHDLRRTAATRLVAAGLDDAQVASWMGWSTGDVTALKRKYVSRDAVLESVLAKLDEAR